MTVYDFLYFLLLMQGLGFIIGLFISALFHWAKW